MSFGGPSPGPEAFAYGPAGRRPVERRGRGAGEYSSSVTGYTPGLYPASSRFSCRFQPELSINLVVLQGSALWLGAVFSELNRSGAVSRISS